MIQLLVLFLFRCGGIKIMAKYGKPSDSIIDYPDLDLTSVEQIEQWLSDLKTEDDLYAIKWYRHYLESEFAFSKDANDIDRCHKIDILISFIRCYIL